MSAFFVEVDSFQKCKHVHVSAGDVFFSRKKKNEDRVIAVLSDGLGSGVKANVLATLTGSMAMRFVENDVDIRRTAELIMRTLPVCSERKISYSTFTIVDIDSSRVVRVIEYDNPAFLLVRDGKCLALEPKLFTLTSVAGRERVIRYTEFEARSEDRLVVYSDGVTQSGMGTKPYPFGWSDKGVREYVCGLVAKKPALSARELAQTIVRKAWSNDAYEAQDDITCGVVYFRKPRKLLVMSGPPFSPDSDKELAGIANGFDGKKVVCGGTTANILSRELERKVSVDLSVRDPEIPPASVMEGFDLVTEGILTLGRAAEMLEQGLVSDYPRRNAATRLVDFLLDSDVIRFLVGTRINEAHQDPNMPVELEIRRNVVKKIARLLEERYLKEVHLEFI